nr:(2Fe-2S) ferredoxin domain-containing protein [Sphingomonas liriopis]
MKRVPSAWTGAVLVCGKCSKKLDGGFGKKGRAPLARMLRKIMGLKKGRKATLGVVETRCLGLCPRDAVAMIDGRAPGTWLVVPRGADVVELAARLEQERSGGAGPVDAS